MSDAAIEGEILWQNNNCVSCHQFYGLGGYLGPDLTNVISHKSKGPKYVRAFINSGVKSMPKFEFSEEEKENIVQFLTYVDKTGIYPNYKAKFKKNGWVEIEYKD
jgi:nitric oxide reductase subunit C